MTFSISKGTIHTWLPSKLSNFQDLPPSPHNPHEIITNQLKRCIILGWLSYFIRSFLQVSFRFLYQLINLVWGQSGSQSNFEKLKAIFPLPLIAKRYAGVKVELKTHYLLCRGFTFLCVQLSKKSRNVFSKKSFFRAHFTIDLVYLHNLKT